MLVVLAKITSRANCINCVRQAIVLAVHTVSDVGVLEEVLMGLMSA